MIMETEKEFESDPAIRSLPNQIRQKLIGFIYKEIPKTKFFKPDGKPDKEWEIFYGSNWDLALESALAEAWRVTRGSAWLPEWVLEKKSLWDSAMSSASIYIWNATWGLERESARLVVRSAAKNSVYELAKDAVWDAVLYSEYILVNDIQFEGKENGMAQANARWKVWQKGYGLLCDIDGVFYVYAIKS